MKLLFSILSTCTALVFILFAVRNLSQSSGTVFFFGAVAFLVAAAMIWKSSPLKA